MAAALRRTIDGQAVPGDDDLGGGVAAVLAGNVLQLHAHVHDKQVAICPPEEGRTQARMFMTNRSCS